MRSVVGQFLSLTATYAAEMDHHGWWIEHTTGTAESFHNRPPPAPLRPTVWIHQLDRPALVLGSTQRAPLLDADSANEAGIEICQRRSGGGLVYVDPEQSLWIDVIVPRNHALWSDDIGLAFHWVGQTWEAALTAIGTQGPIRVHSGKLMHPDWGRVICFAGLGPGEVVADGRKVVGLSQRRTREMARFQGLALTRLDPSALRAHLRPGVLPPDLDAQLDELPVGGAFDPKALSDAFVAALPFSD